VLLPAPLSVPLLPCLPRNLQWNLVGRIKYTQDADAVFKVEALLEGRWKLAILKVYHSDPDTRTRFSTHPGELMFQSESRAYANLLHYQHHTAGLVPHCYGIVQIPDSKSIFPEFADLPYGDDPWEPFREDPVPPKALLLEYIPDVEELALHNLSREVVDASMHALVCINEAHILHNDFTPNNILVGRDGRVVIVDFGASNTHPDQTQEFQGDIMAFFREEYQGAAELFYQAMLPDQARIRRGEQPWYHFSCLWFNPYEDDVE